MCGEGGTKIEYHKGDVHLLVYPAGDYKGSAYGVGEHKLSHPEPNTNQAPCSKTEDVVICTTWISTV